MSEAILTAPADNEHLSSPPAALLLDERDEWRAFSRPLRGQPGRWEATLAIQGIHCAGCGLLIEEALAPLPGVHAVSVNGAAALARIEWSPAQGRPSQWVAALRQAGYGCAPAADAGAATQRQQAQRLLLWRWLVAGFCMMQVMMYATPAYVAAPGEISADAAGLLRWAAWLLSIPVVLFSCQPFFASAWRDLRQARIGMDVPVALGIAVAFAASTASAFDPHGVLAGETWFDSVTMFVFFLLSGRLLEQRLRGRTAGAIEALLQRMPQRAQRVRDDGTTEAVPLPALRPGDRVRVLPGEAFPADACVLEGMGRVDEALLTGESEPCRRGPGDAVVAGSFNLDGALLVRVERAGSHTRYADIVALMERASAAKPGGARLADRFAPVFLAGVLLAAAAAAWWWWPRGPAHALAIAVAVLIVTCPCALSLATPAATLAAAGALARRGILVRRLDALEAAAGIDTVLLDKTGTLTQERRAVTSVRTRAGVTEEEALRLAAALAAGSLHPAALAVRAAAPGELPPVRDLQEHAGRGLEGSVASAVAGQPAVPLRLGSAAFCGLAAGQAPDDAGVHLCDAAGWLASFTLDETLKPDTSAALRHLRQDGLHLALRSGDRARAVERLGARLGVVDWQGGLSPQDKLACVERLQAQGRHVAMVGDGMNDGPVLARADVSIAIGGGVPLAQARSDFIVQGGQVRSVVVILRQARRARRVARQNLAWSAAYNAVCVPLALAGAMPPWLAGLGMAASSLVVVLNAARLARLPD